ncbi:peroxisome biogenesis protein 22-like isoform X2 [Aristolochia californica]|uniref:peroxisome biogenesis protein 22-like isoform X2 n=1 Tax=Aristolochia californica TaxID=171875 RepID=UPI0035D59FF3
MADASKEELVQLIKKIGAYLTVKMSNIFTIFSKQQNYHSIWAVVGLAMAIVFTWKLLKTPTEHQRTPPKHQGPVGSSSANSQSTAATLSAEVGTSSEDSKAQDVIDEFFQPVKPTLSQVVRQKLGEGRKVTCQLLGVILEESTPEDLQKHVTVRSCVVEVLLEITKYCDLYLMERVVDDESEERVLSALENAGVFTSGGLIRDKVLFCSKENGRTSFVRQLEPDWHIDTNREIIYQLAVSVHQVSTPHLAKQNRTCCPKCIQLWKLGAVLWMHGSKLALVRQNKDPLSSWLPASLQIQDYILPFFYGIP